MKKILIFGCSYSAGSYKSDPITDTQIHKTKGWYHFVDYFKNKDVTVIPCGGQGYWCWFQLLVLLDKIHQLVYDEIWIQETIGPRPSLLNIKKIELEIQNPNSFLKLDNITRYYLQPKECLQLSFINNRQFGLEKFDGDIIWELFTVLSRDVAQHFQDFCIEKNISGYVWSMNEYVMECKEFIRLPIKHVHNNLKNKKLIRFDGHQTEEGNKYIGELINKACIDTKI